MLKVLSFFSKLYYVVIIISMMTMHLFIFKSTTSGLGDNSVPRGSIFRVVSGCPAPWSPSLTSEDINWGRAWPGGAVGHS